MCIRDRFLAELARRPDLRLYGRASVDGRTPTFAFNLTDADGVRDASGLVSWLGAVSSTHLDVYKRQGNCRAV